MQLKTSIIKCLQCGKPYDELAPEFQDLGCFSNFCSLKCSIFNWQCSINLPRTFRNFDSSLLQCAPQITAVEQWISDRSNYQGKPGLLCHGIESGAGKTRVGTYAACRLIGEDWSGTADEQQTITDGCGYEGLWFNVVKFKADYLRVHRDGEERGKWSEMLAGTRVLFLDDVDKIKPSEGLLEVLFGVLDARLTDSRTTILTTNLTGETLERRWGDEFGPYLIRRLRDYCLTLDFDL